MTSISPNQFHALYAWRIAEATREFNARGKSVIRCGACQLADYACICPWRPRAEINSEFILLMHRDEVLKPTNTGRLIADVFPNQTHVFCWSRTAPDGALLKLLNSPHRRCLVVFPDDYNPVENDGVTAPNRRPPTTVVLPSDELINTFILLDGTWKQSGRMFHLSRWLDPFPCVALPHINGRGYAVRKSHQADYVSTAEAAALCLHLAGEPQAGELLQDYFALFNTHYLATRACVPPVPGELHARLAAKVAN